LRPDGREREDEWSSCRCNGGEKDIDEGRREGGKLCFVIEAG